MYTFSKEVLQSGDFRTFLAMAPPDTENQKLFQRLIKLDDLITITDGQPPVLSYNGQALAQRDIFRRFMAEQPGVQTVDGMQKLFGMYRGGICVIIGSGPSMNPAVVKELQATGIATMTLGHAATLVKDATFWVGAQDVLTYGLIPFERQTTTAFVRQEQYREPLWDAQQNRQLQRTPRDYPNTFGAPPLNYPTGPQPTSLGLGIQLAVHLGFQDVLLYGVDLGGPVDKYYAFAEIPHADTLRRKTEAYARFQHHFPVMYQRLAQGCIRLGAVDSCPLPLPVYPLPYIRQVLHNVMAMSNRVVGAPVKVSTPGEQKRKYLQAQEQHRAAVVMATAIIDRISQFRDAAPDIFGTEEIAAAEAAIKSASCSGCAKNRHARPAYEAFEKAVLAKDPRVLKAWAQYIPDQYVIRPGLLTGNQNQVLVFREDHAADRIEYEKSLL